MKTRNGFVSNSSSSSFIIDDISLEKIARSMLKIVINNYKEWDEDIDEEDKDTNREYDIWLANLETALQRDDVKNGNLGITFPTTNFNTYILNYNNSVYVSTANNHSWKYTNRDIEYLDENSYTEFKDIMENSFYINMRNNIIHNGDKYQWLENAECSNCNHGNYGYYAIDENGNKLHEWCWEGFLTIKDDKSVDKNDKEKMIKDTIQNIQKFASEASTLKDLSIIQKMAQKMITTLTDF